MEDEKMVVDNELTQEYCYEPEEESGGIMGKVVLGLGAVGVGAAALAAYKFKDKITEHKIKKLEKKGYHVTKVEEVEATEVEDVEDFDE